MFYAAIVCTIVLLFLWCFSRFFVTYTHEYLSWVYHTFPCENGISIGFSEKAGGPIFLRVVVEDIPANIDVIAPILINEFDFFPAIFGCYGENYRFYTPEVGLPLMVEFDRKHKQAIFDYSGYRFSIADGGRTLIYGDIRLAINRYTHLTVFLHKEGRLCVRP